VSEPVRVLLVDDDALVRAGLSMILSAAPDVAVVGEATDGAEVPGAVSQHQPDVVLMDIRMPRVDGLAATETLRSRAGAPEVIVLTTFDADEYVLRALRAGASGFLLKDTPPAQLVDGVRTIARGESLLAPAVTRSLIGHFAERLRPTDTSRPARDTVVRALAPRELEVLEHLAAGLSNAEIAAELVISSETVKTYVSRILTKLDLRDRVQAVVLAYRIGLVSNTD